MNNDRQANLNSCNTWRRGFFLIFW